MSQVTTMSEHVISATSHGFSCQTTQTRAVVFGFARFGMRSAVPSIVCQDRGSLATFRVARLRFYCASVAAVFIDARFLPTVWYLSTLTFCAPKVPAPLWTFLLRSHSCSAHALASSLRPTALLSTATALA